MTLDPTRRQAIYAALVALGAIVTATGLTDQGTLEGWLGIAQAALGALALVLASIKARSVDWTASYAAFAALVVALKWAGIINDGQSSHWLDIAAAVAAFAPLAFAAFRTTSATPTGEPVAEYIAREGSSVGDESVTVVQPTPPIASKEGDGVGRDAGYALVSLPVAIVLIIVGLILWLWLGAQLGSVWVTIGLIVLIVGVILLILSFVQGRRGTQV